MNDFTGISERPAVLENRRRLLACTLEYLLSTSSKCPDILSFPREYIECPMIMIGFSLLDLASSRFSFVGALQKAPCLDKVLIPFDRLE